MRDENEQLSREIKEHKQALEALYIAHKQIMDIIEFLPDATFVIDQNKKVIAWNRAIEVMTGVRKEDIIGKGNYDYSMAFYGKPVPLLIDLIFSDHKETEQRCDFIERNGETLFAEVFVQSVYKGKGAYLWLKASPLYDNDGNLVGAIESIRDITERKQMEDELKKHRDNLEDLVRKRTTELKVANEQLHREIMERNQLEKALQESEEKYRTIFENTGTATAIVDKDNTIIMANTKMLKLANCSKEEHVASSWTKYILLEDLDRVKEYHQRRRINEDLVPKSYEFRHLDKQGRVKDFLATVAMIPGTQKSVVSLIDISDRKRVEEAIKAEQRRLFSLLDGLPGYVYLQAPDYSIRFSNRYFWERFGKPGKRACYEVLHGRKEPCMECPTFRVFDTKSPLKWESIESDGQTYQIYTYPFSDIDGSPLVLVLGIDITDHKRAEKALRLSEERFSKAFNTSPNPMVIITLTDGRYIEVNNSFLYVTGYHREEIIGHTAIELNLWAKPEVRAVMIRILNEHGVVQNLESNFRMKSGEERIGLLSAEIIDLNGEQCLLTVVNDITERKQLEQDMARLDRLNLVGEMAAGIGHEIRNPMTTVRGFLQLLGSKKEYIQDKEYFDLMIEELDRANSIITEFLSLAKNKVVELSEHNLNSIVKAIYPLIQADAMRMDNNIKLDLVSVPNLLLDEKEIRQLILNLVRNGLEAMSPGGNLTIRTFTDGDEVVLTVKDQGIRIEPDVLEKIGTPFFTTKDNGTGLGLAVCYSISARHNAKINIETHSKGTTFYVLFKR